MAKTKKPTGLTVKRNGSSLILSWKKGDKNYSGGQTLQYRLKVNGNWRGWQNLSVGASTTSKSLSISPSSYFPNNKNKLSAVEFRLKGKRSGRSYSDWVSISYTIDIPRNPVISSSLGSSSNVLSITWSVDSKSDDKKQYSKYEWQSILVDDSNETDGSKLSWSKSNRGWKTGTGASAEGTFSITEDSSITSGGSHTRWVRIRATGVAGASVWKYTKHVYAIPYAATISKHSVTKRSSSFLVDITWKASSNASHPIDQTTVEYSIAIPQANMQVPSGTSWQEANVSKDTSGNDRAVFTIGDTLDDDQCIFVRVVTTHDNRNNYSGAVLIYKGKLASPSDLTISVTGSQASIQVTNNSQACVYSGSDPNIKRLFLQVIYRGVKYNTKGINIGVIPSGSSSVSVRLPDVSKETSYAIGVRAIVGTYTSEQREDGTTRYTIKAEMTSDVLWGAGAVPIAPANVTAEFDGNLVVTWEWSWEQATEAEISWSEHEDAWESTDEPSRFDIDYEVTRWTIKDLEPGRKYYVRVRLSSNGAFSPYSEMVEVNTTLPPEKPILMLSDGAITQGGKTTASWNYVSGDGSDQAYAEIVVNNQVVAHVESQKYITLYAKDMGWIGGNEYSLQLRVKSESGSFSEYSDPVSVLIAEPLECEISQTSLEEQHIEKGNNTHEGDIVSFNSDDNPIIKSLVANIEPIQSGTGDPSPSNVRPISGWSGVDVGQSGKNLFDMSDLFQGNLDGLVSDGNVSTNNCISIKGGTQYTLTTPVMAGRYIRFYDESKTEITGTRITWYDRRLSHTFTTPNNAVYMRFMWFSPSAITVAEIIASESQIELGSTATEYAPYQGETITKALGQTVYGGTLDLISGELTITKQIFNVNFSGRTGTSQSGKYAFYSTVVPNIVRPAYAEYPTGMLCNRLEVGTRSNTYNANKDCVSIHPTEGRIYTYVESLSAMTLAEAQAWLTENPIQVVYPLLTPEVIQLTGEQVQTLLGVNNIWADSGEMSVETVEEMRDILALTEMPLTVTVVGAKEGLTRVVIERAEPYFIDRPDERKQEGHEGETVFLTSYFGENQLTINTNDLIGLLDDGAKYRLIGEISDNMGQTSMDSLEFEVHWTHQAIEPLGTVEIDGVVAKITPIAPQGAIPTDKCDIYRLSADRPQLVYPNAEFGQTYVDPYPAINGGYRLVLKTENGDYITEDNAMAWLDIESGFDYDKTIIDFDDDRAELYYNVDTSHKWNKDFRETKYLGGAVQGDWNPAVSRSASVSAITMNLEDQEIITALRRLAVYSGICNVRTKDGSSFHADVQVSENNSHDKYGLLTEFSLEITRVDPQGYDGVSLEAWED